MPIYEYRCQSCEQIIEAIQTFSAPPLTVCENCGGDLKKLISRSAFHLKGSGWYSDHYGLKSGDAGKKETSASGGDGASAVSKDTTVKAADAKTEPKKSADTEVKKSAQAESKPAAASSEASSSTTSSSEAKPSSSSKVPSAAA